MPKPDLENIITSPEAEMFLQMVTKGFYNSSFMGLWMYEVIGREWDEMRAWAEGLKDEIHPRTCTWSMPIWEWVYGIPEDSVLPLEYRRQKILAKIAGTTMINPELIRRGIATLTGQDLGNIEVRDFAAPYSFQVRITASLREYPASEILRWVREVKPSHLAFGISVETKAAIQGGMRVAAAVVTVPTITIMNRQQAVE